MTDFERILDLADRWDETPANQRVTLEVFCEKSPELLGEFRQFLAQRSAFGQALQGDCSTADPEALVGKLHSDRFQLVRFHDSGGLGWVYVAEDRELGRSVAVKCLQPAPSADPEATRRFLREAEITAKLEHPGVVPVYGMDKSREQPSPYYAMRFVNGETMRAFIRRLHGTGKPVDWSCIEATRLLKAFVNVCETVAYAHSRGVIHRDLKPLNVMLGPYGETFVMDWGLAKSTAESEQQVGDAEVWSKEVPESATRAGRKIGTLGFMSPEQARGDWKEVGPASDQFSLGAVLYQILANDPPFHGPNVLEDAIACRFSRPREKQPGIPRPLEAICLKAMSREPASRYLSVQELKADIERYMADLPVDAREDSPFERMQRLMRRHKTTVAGAGLLSLAIVGLLAFFLEQSFRKNRDLEAANAGWQNAARLAEDERTRAESNAEQATAEREVAQRNANESEELVNRLLTVMNLSDPRLQSKVVTVAELVGMLTENEGFYQGLSLKQQFRLKLGFARSLLGSGQTAKARKLFEEVVAISSQVLAPDDELNLHIRRDLAVILDDPERSINILRDLVDNTCFSAEQRAYVGIKLIERLHLASREQDLRNYMPRVRELCFSLDASEQLTPFRFEMIEARVLYNSGRAVEALPICRRLASEIPEGISPAVAVEPIIQLGECLERLSLWEESLENYQKAEAAYLKILGSKHPAMREVSESRKRVQAELERTSD